MRQKLLQFWWLCWSLCAQCACGGKILDEEAYPNQIQEPAQCDDSPIGLTSDLMGRGTTNLPSSER